jgi:hypothetical protein
MSRRRSISVRPGLECLEPRRALAVAVRAPIDDFVMPIGSAAAPVTIRLTDHFSGGGSSLRYTVWTRHGYVAPAVDATGVLTIRGSASVPPGFATAIDNVTVVATSTTDADDARVLAFTVFQKAPVRVSNAVVAMAGGDLWVAKTELSGTPARGRLEPPAQLSRVGGQPAGSGSAASFVGDFNGDHADDLAWLDGQGRVWVDTKIGDSAASVPTVWGGLPADVGWETVTAGDFTGDGLFDLAVRNPHNGNWRLLVSSGSGSFAPPVRFGTWSTAVARDRVLTGDFDGNATTDLAARDPQTGDWWVSRSTADGFVTTRFGRMGTSMQSFFAGDFTGDGRADLAGRNPVTGRWRVLASQGTQFAPARVFGEWAPGVRWTRLKIGDFDGDGRADLAGCNATTGEWLVSRSTGQAFTTTIFGAFANPGSWQSPIAGDFNFDGKTDIVARNRFTGAWRMLRSTGTGFEKAAVVGSWPTATAWTNLKPIRIAYDAASTQGSGSISGGTISGGTFAVGTIASGAFAAAGDPNVDWQVDPLDVASSLSNGLFDAGANNSPPATSSVRPTTGEVVLSGEINWVVTPPSQLFIVVPSQPSLQAVTQLNGVVDRPLSLIGSGVARSPVVYGPMWYTVLGTSQDATFGPKGFYKWNLSPAYANGTAGRCWDLFHVGGVLDIAATAAEPFELSVSAIPDAAGDSFDGSREYAWTIVEAVGGINGFAAEKFVITDATTGVFPGPLSTGHVTLVQAGTTLQLKYKPKA